MNIVTDTLMQRLTKLIQYLVTLDSVVRRGMLLLLDAAIICFAVWCGFWLRLDIWQPISKPLVTTIFLAWATWICVSLIFGTYRNILRFSGSRTVVELLLAILFHMLAMAAILFALEMPGVPRTVSVIHALIMGLMMLASRFAIRAIVMEATSGGLFIVRRDPHKRNILIYGAGMAGRQLLQSIKDDRTIKVRGFIDDNPSLANRRLDGTRVFSPHNLEHVSTDNSIDEIVLAIPSISRAQRREIVEKVQLMGVKVRMMPDLSQILNGKITVNDLHSIDVDDLLGRDIVFPDKRLLSANVFDKVVMVTGAGGSIGSELSRQLLALQPKMLILLEMSEYALYAIDSELRAEMTKSGNSALQLVPELANCSDADLIHRIMGKYRPDTVFHAAAYKHVPILESNPIAGAANNILGTLATSKAAEQAGVSLFILVSTDKAVRPPNVMGATKRICELILQSLQARGSGTKFAMVRFGNVLGSSGSVVPQFRKQIEQGGPVTVTDREITRYFMTISEAAQLVIQAGTLAKGGEVFLLDMGEPVRIQQLAEMLIHLSGLTVRNAQNPDGDIEIRETGLRPGEKLYEELLIDSAAMATDHAAIFMGQEPIVEWDELSRQLETIAEATATGNVGTLLQVLERLVPGFKAMPPAVVPPDQRTQIRENVDMRPLY